MIKILENIIKQIILPKFPEIGFFKIREEVESGFLKYTRYIVMYSLRENISYKKHVRIEEETKFVFRMVNNDKKKEVSVVIFYE